MDKRKRLEEEALAKTLEAEACYRNCVTEANERHRNLLHVKADILKQVRELILQVLKILFGRLFKMLETASLPSGLRWRLQQIATRR